MRPSRCLRHAVRLLTPVLLGLLLTGPADAQGPPASPRAGDGDPLLVDLTRATIVTPSSLDLRERTAVRVLVEEVEKRTRIRLPVSSAWPVDTVPASAVGP